jgi:hypothetical protein
MLIKIDDLLLCPRNNRSSGQPDASCPFVAPFQQEVVIK